MWRCAECPPVPEEVRRAADLLGRRWSLAVLYAAQVLSGCGSGIVYGISMGNALKWFPDRRGLCAGLTAAGFGAGSTRWPCWRSRPVEASPGMPIQFDPPTTRVATCVGFR